MMAPAWIAVLLLLVSVREAAPAVFPERGGPPRPPGNALETIVCPPECDCIVTANDNLAVDCGRKNLDSFPESLPPLTYQLDLASNNILKLSCNSDLGALNSLDASSNRISEIDRRWLGSLAHLERLDVSKNALRSKAVEDAFRDLPLSHVDLSDNPLEGVTDAMFLRMNGLLSLNLSSCEIERVSYDGFRDLNELTSLDLSHNRIVDVQHEWLKNLQSLQRLYLQHNSIKFLRNVLFSTLKDLRVLDLSENHIKSVGQLSFKGLTRLRVLNVSGNDISHLQPGVFRSLESAETIDLSENSVSGMDNVFTHAKSLERLHLRNSRGLKYMSEFSLHGARNLMHLDLSGSSSLSEIHSRAFSHSRDLDVLDLSGANLTNLKMGIFDGFRGLGTLKLSGNPWRCDCHMYWVLPWLGEHTHSHLLAPSETHCGAPDILEGHVLLDALDHSMVCTNATIQHHTNRTKFKVGLPAHLECSADGSPLPEITWITPRKETFYWDGVKNVSLPGPTATEGVEVERRFRLTPGGGLAIDRVERGDGGFYVCVASNPLGRDSVSIRLTLDYSYLVHIKIVSVLVGLATSFGFLLVTLVSVLVRMVLRHFGVRCGCRNGNASPRSQQIKKILESMEHYKRQQLDRLRGNYNMQVQKIKDNCMQQMERLRESYSSQAECLRDFREYGTLQIDRIRENYYSQVQRVRDYSAGQIVRLRENYLCQRDRIRKFSAHSLYKLRENCKTQQQHLNKILENFNIESCRNVCQRAESATAVFETPADFTLALQRMVRDGSPGPANDSNDNSSQASAYFTPDEAGSEVSDLEVGFRRGRAVVAARGGDVALTIEDKATSTSDISKCYYDSAEARYGVLDHKLERSDRKSESPNYKCETSDHKSDMSDHKCETPDRKCDMSDCKCETPDHKCDMSDNKCDTPDLSDAKCEVLDTAISDSKCENGVSGVGLGNQFFTNETIV